MTHNQGVDGSSPAGPTKNRASVKSEIDEHGSVFFFTLKLTLTLHFSGGFFDGASLAPGFQGKVGVAPADVFFGRDREIRNKRHHTKMNTLKDKEKNKP